MSLSSLKRFLPAPPPRQVVLLADTLFFVKSVPVTEGATAPEVTMQAELAVESLAPFPVAQLFYGFYWRPGAGHALIYAAYRKRFASDEVEAWSSAEVVLPAFVTMLSGDNIPKPGTVWVIPGANWITGVYFADASGVPTQVRVETLLPDADNAQRAEVREKVLNAFPEKFHVNDFAQEPVFNASSPQGEFVFKAGATETHFNASDLALLDVRDKDELTARRRAHKRDVILWKTFLVCLALIALSLLLELALVGSSVWQKQRLAREELQRPVVESIMTSQSLATRIDELSTKRLLPFEMLAIVNTVRPATIQFMITSTSGLYSLQIEAQTSSPGDIEVYRTALNSLPEREKVEVLNQRSRDGVSTFQLNVTFKPEMLQSRTETAVADPADSPAPPLPVAPVPVTPVSTPELPAAADPAPAATATPLPAPEASQP